MNETRELALKALRTLNFRALQSTPNGIDKQQTTNDGPVNANRRTLNANDELPNRPNVL
jgi:hypothetical protein